MKKILILTLFFGLAAGVQAQLLGKFDIGVRGGATANIVGYNSQYQSNRGFDNSFREIVGFEVGIPMAYHFTDVLALQWEVNLQQRQNRYTAYYDKADKDRYLFSEKQKNLFLDVPVLLNISFGGEHVRGFVNAGLYFGAWVYGDRAGKISSSPIYAGALEDSYTEYRLAKEWNQYDQRFDMGLSAGVGMRWLCDQPVAMSLEFRFNYGFMTRQKQASISAFNVYDTPLALTLGLHFNTAKTAWIKPE